jgi:hypothetical protein
MMLSYHGGKELRTLILFSTDDASGMLLANRLLIYKKASNRAAETYFSTS